MSKVLETVETLGEYVKEARENASALHHVVRSYFDDAIASGAAVTIAPDRMGVLLSLVEILIRDVNSIETGKECIAEAAA